MDHQGLIITLRLLHILGGAFWFGAALLTTWFMLPSVRAAGPSGGAFMREIGQRRKLPLVMNVAALVTVLAGLGLYWQMSAASDGAYARSSAGMAFGFGGAVAVLAWVVGFTMVRPAGVRLGAIGASLAAAGGSPTAEQLAELEATQDRIARGSKLSAVLLTVAAAVMAVARYV